MEPYVEMTAQTFRLVAKHCDFYPTLHDEPYTSCIKYKSQKITIFSNDKSKCSRQYYRNIFSKYTLIELRQVLYLLSPYALHKYKSRDNRFYVDVFSHIKLAIKFIEKDLYLGINEDLENNVKNINNERDNVQAKIVEIINTDTVIDPNLCSKNIHELL